MAKIDGKFLRIEIDGATIVGSITDEISFEKDMIDATTKDSTDGAKEYLAGEVGGTFTATFAYDQDAASTSVDELWDSLYDGTIVAFIYGGVTAGDLAFSGNAFVQSQTISGPKNELATVDVSFQITGPITRGTVS
jgi:predicted secreted protein